MHALKDMLHVLDVKLSTDHVDCYVLGATADLIGNELMAVIAQHSTLHEHESHGADIGPVSLLLIDRVSLCEPLFDTCHLVLTTRSADTRLGGTCPIWRGQRDGQHSGPDRFPG